MEITLSQKERMLLEYYRPRFIKSYTKRRATTRRSYISIYGE